MDTFYSNEKAVQMTVAPLKAHGIKKIIASPGTTNITLVASLQCDPYFEIYSAAEERSAAYMACGLAAETGEPVVLSCTGATASRNYLPGLTEAYYRKLPVLAITSTQHMGRVGQHMAQVIDRSAQPSDTVKLSVQIPTIHNDEDAWACNVALNKAMLELRRHGGGPVHINLATDYSKDFSVKELPPTRVIRRVSYTDVLPQIPRGCVAILVGAHTAWSAELTKAVDDFCSSYNGVVLCDQTSNYRGPYRVLATLVTSQEQSYSNNMSMDLLIHIGEVSGAYTGGRPKEVWRVDPDGEVRDTYRKLSYVFEMEKTEFFKRYTQQAQPATEATYHKQWQKEYDHILAQIPELPFSNLWVAQYTAGRLPENSVLHLGILNTLRSWNFFETPATVCGYSNTGGFGIDGNVSSLLGASLAHPERLYFGFVGDLAFFYDMNALGNRNVGRNLRLMVINNGRGTEFRNYTHPAARFGADADAYMAAAGHYGNKSPQLVRHYAQDLGFEYLTAANKEEYLANVDRFLTPQMTEKPILFEVFTDSQNESDALKMVRNAQVTSTGTVKKLAKEVLGQKGVETLRKLVQR